jgi:hypothetical protein
MRHRPFHIVSQLPHRFLSCDGYRRMRRVPARRGSDRGELMVKMTEEQRAERAAKRRRAEAEAAEARQLQREVNRREWAEKGMYLTYEEMMAGMACRACGEILCDGKGKPVIPINNLIQEEQCEIDDAEAKFGERHPDCREGNWRIQGSQTQHCNVCCPPPPMSATQREKIRSLFSWTVSPRILNRWELTLT